VGLVGPNGSGKTTIFRLITHEEEPDAGRISVDRGISIGYFSQEIGEMKGRSVVETTLDGVDELTTTIEHVASTPVNGKLRWRVTTVGQSVPLTHAGALEWAVSFAAMHDIPIVYQRDEGRVARYAATGTRPSAAASSASK